METRRLGRTNHQSTLVIMGTAAFWEIDQEGANAALDLAQSYGVNHIDVAPQYGNAQRVLGEWLAAEPGRRANFFIGCKTLERSRDAAWADLENSFKLLHTDHLELYQLHAITTQEELDAALAPGGAIETLVEARAQGLVDYLGLTGHGLQAPALQLQALQRFDFDTLMVPIYPALYASAQYRRDMAALLAEAQARDVGIMAIKSAARGAWPAGVKTHQTWYQPYTTYPEVERGVRFALSQPGVTAIPSVGDVRILPLVLKAAENFRPMTPEEQEAAIAATAGETPIFTEAQAE